MKHHRRAFLRLERLEDRWCPTVSAGVSASGLLTVSGTTPDPTGDTVTIKETAAGTFSVSVTGATTIDNLKGVNSVKVALTGSSGNKYDLVVDLGTFTLAKNLDVQLGTGTQNVTVEDGTVSGALNITGKGAVANVTLGATGTTLSVGKDTHVDPDHGGPNGVSVLTGVTLNGNLEVDDTANVTFAAGSSVARDLEVFGTSAGNTVDVEGKVGRDLELFGPFFSGNKTSPSSLTLGGQVARDLVFVNAYKNTKNSSLTLLAGSSVGRDLYYEGSGQGDVVTLSGSIARTAYLDLEGGSNTFTLNGSVGKNLYLNAGNGTNQVTLAAGSTVSGYADVDLGNGSNTVTLAGTIGTSGSKAKNLDVHAGKGGDTVTFLGSAVVNGSANVVLGPGVNLLDLYDAATITGTLTAKGGGNALSTFHGRPQSATHATLNVSGFPVTNSNPH